MNLGVVEPDSQIFAAQRKTIRDTASLAIDPSTRPRPGATNSGFRLKIEGSEVVPRAYP